MMNVEIRDGVGCTNAGGENVLVAMSGEGNIGHRGKERERETEVVDANSEWTGNERLGIGSIGE